MLVQDRVSLTGNIYSEEKHGFFLLRGKSFIAYPTLFTTW